MPEAARFLNLVFQGGGVRGIAYVGALSKMPANYKIHAVGGTSAGSIVAALLAVGKTPAQIRDLLRDPALLTLLDSQDEARVERLWRAWSDCDRLLALALAGKRVRLLCALRTALKKHRPTIAMLGEAWQQRGLYSTNKIREWLDRILEGKTFADLSVDDLRIVAADVNGRRYEVYSKESGNMPIAQAVHASISIPIFFEPLTLGPLHLVDGGLLSNFPSYLFAEAKYPTIGFRLHEIAPPARVDSTAAYLKALLLTMVEAHDKRREPPPFFKAYTIETPAHISATKFALEQRDLDELYVRGEAVGGAEVEWERYSSPTPEIPYYEPDPRRAFQLSLKNARRLWESYASPALWVTRLEHDALVTVQIEADWSTRYDRSGRIEVYGSKALFMFRSVVSGIPKSAAHSFADLPFVCEEVTDTGVHNMIRIPAFIDEGRRGFVVFYNPPLAEGQGPRTFHTGFSIKEEFAQTLGKGMPGAEVSYQVRQVADTHTVHLKFRLLVDVSLPPLRFQPNFGGAVQETGPYVDRDSARAYRVFECDAGHAPVDGETQKRIEITMA